MAVITSRPPPNRWHCHEMQLHEYVFTPYHQHSNCWRAAGMAGQGRCGQLQHDQCVGSAQDTTYSSTASLSTLLKHGETCSSFAWSDGWPACHARYCTSICTEQYCVASRNEPRAVAGTLDMWTFDVLPTQGAVAQSLIVAVLPCGILEAFPNPRPPS
jgi:hypothetical protein